MAIKLNYYIQVKIATNGKKFLKIKFITLNLSVNKKKRLKLILRQ